MNLCREQGFLYRNFEFCEEYACFECPVGTAKKLQEACGVRGIAVVSRYERGVPSLLKRYRHRYGVFVGALLFCAIVIASQLVIWDVRVEGNERLSDAEIKEELRENGLSVGAWRASLDIDGIENRTLVYSDEISWLSVNVIGTVANVEVRECEEIEERAPEYAAANLVAAKSGVIEGFEDVRGNIAVEIGEAVGKGDLLVGGLYGSEEKPSHYTCARGKVFARTEREFLVEIPLEYQKKTYTGEVKVEKYMIFFEKEVKFFGNSRNLPASCDTIDTVEYWETPLGAHLPVGIRTVRYYAYAEETARRSESAAMELAYYTLRCQMEETLAGAELLRKQVSAEIGETAYVLKCYTECIENIAVTQEIRIRGISQ